MSVNNNQSLELAFPVASHSSLERYVENYIIDGEVPTESRCHKVTRLTSQTVASLFILIGQLAFINASRVATGDETKFDEAYGWFLALCNCGAFGTLDAYAIYNVVNDIIRVLPEEEKEILASEGARKTDLLLRIGAFALAIFAVVPHMYMGYAYNDQSVSLALLAAATDIWLPTFSLYLSGRDIKKSIGLSSFEKQLKASKEDLIFLIDEYRASFLNKSDTDLQSNVISVFDQLKQDSTERRAQQLMLTFVNEERAPEQQPSRLRKLGLRATQVFGGTLAVSVIGFMGKIGYNFASHFTDSYLLNTTAGAFVAGCSGYLTTQLIMDGCTSYYDLLANGLNKELPKSYGYRYQMKTTLALKLISLIASTFAYGPTLELAKDNFDGVPEDYMKVTAPIAFFVVCSYLTLSLVDEVMEGYVGKFGTDMQKNLMSINSKLKSLSKVLRDSPLVEYAKFIGTLDNSVLETLQSRVDIVQEGLEEYLNAKSESTPLIV